MNTTAGASISGTAGNAGNITIDVTKVITLLGATIPQISLTA